jgi:hypothetical protein
MNTLRRYVRLATVAVLASMVLVLSGGIGVVVHLCKRTGETQLGLWESPHAVACEPAACCRIAAGSRTEALPACCAATHKAHAPACHQASQSPTGGPQAGHCPCCEEDFHLLKLQPYETETSSALLLALPVFNSHWAANARCTWALGTPDIQPQATGPPPEATGCYGRTWVLAVGNLRI